MADFTLNAPGTTNDPWTPANVIVPVSTIKSDATGFRAHAAGTDAAFAHNVAYGSVITATVTVAAGATSSSDDIVLGATVRSGGNAGAVIGLNVQSTQVVLVTISPTGTITGISTGVAHTRAISDVFSCTVSISGGTATISAKVNGGSNFSFNANTTTTYASEVSLAAGAQFSPQNTNALYLSQFTGTGVAGTAYTLTAAQGAFTLAGEAAQEDFAFNALQGSFGLAGFGITKLLGVISSTVLYGLAGHAASLTWSGASSLPNYLPKWTPFDFACRLRCLQQGTLNIGNTQQNKLNLYNLAVANANGSATWAKWRTAGANIARVHSNLRIYVPNVPGYVAPPDGAGSR